MRALYCANSLLALGICHNHGGHNIYQRYRMMLMYNYISTMQMMVLGLSLIKICIVLFLV